MIWICVIFDLLESSWLSGRDKRHALYSSKIMKGLKLTLLCLSQLITLALTFSIREGTVRVGKRVLNYGEIETQEVKTIGLTPSDNVIKIDFTLADDTSKAPGQAVVVLDNGKGLSESFVPKYRHESRELSISIPVKKLASNTKSQEKIFLSLIVADSSKGKNLYKRLAEIVPSAELRDTVKLKPANDVHLKPEIHHQFKKEKKTVNFLIPVVFIVVAFVLFLGLFLSWSVAIGSDLFGMARQVSGGINTPTTIGFLLCLFGYEVVFFRYFLGVSIFTTIWHSFLLGGPCVYLGSRVFRKLTASRKSGN